MRQAGLAPIFNESTRLLIIGTFPSQKSLALGQYYANPQNNFWRIMGGLMGLPLVDMSYKERTTKLLSVGVGLWDAIESCMRDGSMDHKILDPKFNAIQSLAAQCRSLRAVACNGKLAGKFIVGKIPYACPILASSSPANTGLPLAKKIELWRLSLCEYL